MDVFNLVAGAASILGLGASLWAVAEVRRLRRRYTRLGVLPPLIVRLDDHASALTELLETVAADPAPADLEVACIKATLTSLRRILRGSNKRDVESVQRQLSQKQPVQYQEQVRAIRSAVYELHETLQLYAEEDRWA